MNNRYKITCTKCKESRVVGFTGNRIDWLDNKIDEKIISGRKRLDGEWGWECLCGNRDILTKQEQSYLINSNGETLSDITEKLKVQKPKFAMEVL